MRVITISRTYGSGGSLFGRKLAERLGYRYVDEGFIAKMKTNKEASAVLMLNLEDEKSPGFLDSILDLMHNKSYFRIALAVALYDLVLREDIVVVGGGGHLILQDFPLKISVQIYRNLFDRVQDISREKGIGHSEALDLIEKMDKGKKRFISYYFDNELFDPTAFHITLNASKVSIDDAVDLVESYCGRYFERIDPIQAESFAAAKLLEKRAQLAVFHLKLIRSGKVSFEVLEPRVLVVKGIIGGNEDKERLLKALRSLKGVDTLIDQLKTGVLSRMLRMLY